jgi:hypothetical protein
MMSFVLDSSIVGCWCFPDETGAVADMAFEQLGCRRGDRPSSLVV